MATAVATSGDNVVHPKSLYVIPAETPEKKRLATQYLFKKALYGWNSPIPPVIDVSRLSNVLDVAAGTCAWTFDLASLPGVSERLAEGAENRVRLYACDIDTRFFPEKSLTDRLGITTFQQDATEPFPEDLRGKFDLVHVSFLFMCLTKEGWQKTLRHFYDVLKPGGILMLDEADPIMYAHPSSVPPEDASGHDVEKALNDTTWVGKANRIYTGMAVQSGFFTDLTYRLPELSKAIGFEIQYAKRAVAPAGPHCRLLMSESESAEFVDFSVDNLTFVFKHLAAAQFAKGTLRNPDGTLVETEAARDGMMADVAEGLRREGAVSVGRCFIAKKL